VSTSSRPRLRVALSATPPLLADSLRSLLADEDTDVVLVLDAVTGSRRTDTGGFDVAITTSGIAPVEADVVIVLDDRTDSRGGGTMRRGPQVRDLSDLDAVVATVRGLRPTGDEQRG
jgi:hypothetical protein